MYVHKIRQLTSLETSRWFCRPYKKLSPNDRYSQQRTLPYAVKDDRNLGQPTSYSRDPTASTELIWLYLGPSCHIHPSDSTPLEPYRAGVWLIGEVSLPWTKHAMLQCWYPVLLLSPLNVSIRGALPLRS